jgi:hypothetical protein
MGGMSSLASVYLGGNALSGTIPASFASLTSLALLNVSTNSFSGTLPAMPSPPSGWIPNLCVRGCIVT